MKISRDFHTRAYSMHSLQRNVRKTRHTHIHSHTNDHTCKRSECSNTHELHIEAPLLRQSPLNARCASVCAILFASSGTAILFNYISFTFREHKRLYLRIKNIKKRKNKELKCNKRKQST